MISLYDLSDSDLNKLLATKVKIIEKVNASTIVVQVDESMRLRIYKDTKLEKELGSKSADPMSLSYKRIYDYFKTKEDNIKQRLTIGDKYVFSYCNGLSKIVTYDFSPKNDLILDCIIKYGDIVIKDYESLEPYKNVFECDIIPYIFDGYLTPDQQSKILEFIANYNAYGMTSELFTSSIIPVLNPSMTQTFLNPLYKAIDSLIFRFEDSKKTYKMTDPRTINKIKAAHNEDNKDYVSILLSHFIMWCSSHIDKIISNTEEITYSNILKAVITKYILFTKNLNIAKEIKSSAVKSDIDTKEYKSEQISDIIKEQHITDEEFSNFVGLLFSVFDGKNKHSETYSLSRDIITIRGYIHDTITEEEEKAKKKKDEELAKKKEEIEKEAMKKAEDELYDKLKKEAEEKVQKELKKKEQELKAKAEEEAKKEAEDKAKKKDKKKDEEDGGDKSEDKESEDKESKEDKKSEDDKAEDVKESISIDMPLTFEEFIRRKRNIL